MKLGSTCPVCNGAGGFFLEEYVGHGFIPKTKCKRCKGTGTAKLNIKERTESRKYGDVIQPVRDLAIENSGLRNTLRALSKRHKKVRYKRNKLARQVKEQGEYIERLKLRLIVGEEHQSKLIELLRDEIRWWRNKATT